MSIITDGWDETPLGSYPKAPGFKERTTSRAAASAMRGRARILRDMALAEIRAAGPDGLTADEVARRLGESVLAVRPRVSELANDAPAMIAPTGARRANESGLKAKVWRAA